MKLLVKDTGYVLGVCDQTPRYTSSDHAFCNDYTVHCSPVIYV